MTALIHFLTGDATCPVGDGNKIIAHVCNDAGKWGKGFVLDVSHRWRRPEAQYRKWHSLKLLKLGTVQLVKVRPATWVANMVAQHGIYSKEGVPPIRYDTLAKCLGELGLHAHQLRATIHMPRIGCGLAGGSWDKVEKLIRDTLPGTKVFVYDLPERENPAGLPPL